MIQRNVLNSGSSESIPLLQRRPSSFSSSLRRKSSSRSEGNASIHDARHVLSRPSGVIGEVNAAAHRDIVKKAQIRNVIFPFDVSYQIWWGVTALGAVMTAFLLPYEIAFQDQDSGRLEDWGAVVENILLFIFTLDIVINFNLAIYKDTRLTFQRSEIIKSYLHGMFWIDLCGVFPFQTVAMWVAGNIDDGTGSVALLFSLWRLPRLVRLHRLKKLSDIMQFDGHISFLWFTLIRNFAAVLLVAHWEACTMYFLARLKGLGEDTWLGPLVADNESNTTFDLYLTSLYLSVVTFCTVGYGDFSPHNAVEQLFGTIFMLLNIVIAAWIIGSITLLIVKGDERTGAYRDNLDSLQQYGRMHNFDDNFMKGLKSQLKLGFQNQEISDEQVLKPFPSAIRRKILRRLYLKPLLQTQLMKGVRQQFVDAFLASCRVEMFSAGERIVERGSILSDLFLLVGGIAESNDKAYSESADIEQGKSESFREDDANGDKFETGDFVGEIGFFTESPQVESVTCLTVCKTLTLSRSQYKLLESDHPNSAGKILQNLLEKVETISLQLNLPQQLPVLRAGSVFLNDAEETEPTESSFDFGVSAVEDLNGTIAKDEALTAVKDLIEMHMSKQLDDQTTRLLFAAARGDTATISLMCDQGFDPNNADYDHRTALMVASMKGNSEVVKMLLDFKADPNLEDMHGSTALLEAVKNGHEDTMALLKRHGGKLCMNESIAASILCQAVFDGDSTLLRRLLEAGTPVNAGDYDMRTASHIAAAEGNLAAFRVLVKHGAKLDLLDRWGNSPPMEAERHESKKILEFLKSSRKESSD